MRGKIGSKIILIVLFLQLIFVASTAKITVAVANESIIRDTLTVKKIDENTVEINFIYTRDGEGYDTTITATKLFSSKFTAFVLLTKERERYEGRLLPNASSYKITKSVSGNSDLEKNWQSIFKEYELLSFLDSAGVERIFFTKKGNGSSEHLKNFDVEKSNVWITGNDGADPILISDKYYGEEGLSVKVKNEIRESIRLKNYYYTEKVKNARHIGDLLYASVTMLNAFTFDKFLPEVNILGKDQSGEDISSAKMAATYLDGIYDLTSLKIEELGQSSPRAYFRKKNIIGGKSEWYYLKLNKVIESKNGEYFLWFRSEKNEKIWLAANITRGYAELVYLEKPVIGWADEYKIFGGQATKKIDVDNRLESVIIAKIFNECDTEDKCKEMEFSKIVDFPDEQNKYKSKFSGGPIPPPGAIAVNSNGHNKNSWLNRWGVGYEVTNEVAAAPGGGGGCSIGWVMKEINVGLVGVSVPIASGDAPAILSKLGISENNLNVFTKLAVCVHVWVLEPIIENMSKLIEDAAGITRVFFRKHYA